LYPIANKPAVAKLVTKGKDTPLLSSVRANGKGPFKSELQESCTLVLADVTCGKMSVDRRIRKRWNNNFVFAYSVWMYPEVD
jgi:hypothetical protein